MSADMMGADMMGADMMGADVPELDELADPPYPPRSARTAGLRVELADAQPLDHLARSRPRRPRVTALQVGYYFLPYLVLAACIVAAILIPEGLHR